MQPLYTATAFAVSAVFAASAAVATSATFAAPAASAASAYVPNLKRTQHNLLNHVGMCRTARLAHNSWSCTVDNAVSG